MNKEDEIIKKIKSKGYWEIHIHPGAYIEKRIESRTKVKEIIRNAVVELRGWDYPHFHDNEGEPYNIENGIEKSIDWVNHIEFWRMTQSANFIHFLALREDWMENIESLNIFYQKDELKGKKLLGILGSLYTLTEIFEFAKRVASQNVFDQSIVINIKLHDILNRELYVDASNRFPFPFPFVSQVKGPWTWANNYAIEELTSNPHEFSFFAFKDILDLFGLENPPIDNLKNDQQKFLESKL